jgi:hypothetical protein
VVASLVLSASGLNDDKLVKLGNLISLPIEPKPNEKGPGVVLNPNEKGLSVESPVSEVPTADVFKLKPVDEEAPKEAKIEGKE